jgi:NADPH:quinone reductase-like Zn-dependent oxidoreductase
MNANIMNRVTIVVASAATIVAVCAVASSILRRFRRPPRNAEACPGKPIKWMLDKAGDMSRLYLAPVPACDLAADCVRVSVRFVGLNFADVCACQGLYSATPSAAFTPGLEFSGVVTEIGASVRSVKVGEEVMGVARFGSYTQEIVVDCRQVFRLPVGWSLSHGAAFLCTSLTAWYGLLKIGHLQAGQLVAIQSAAGGVGLAATEIVLGMGGQPLCIVGSEAKVDVLLNRGAQIDIRDIALYITSFH